LCFLASQGLAADAPAAGLVTASNSGTPTMEHADRDIPKPKPVLHGGVRYEAVRNPRMRGFEQAGGVIAAIDAKSKAELWILKVYDIVYSGGEERDAQENFITHLAMDKDGKHLFVTNERGQVFQVDIETRTVSEVSRN
jgi:hypothetical protein